STPAEIGRSSWASTRKGHISASMVRQLEAVPK
ncbi:MAG: hypothetical protein ACI8W8_003453, partial [Rhodothermales bacterium]